MKSKEQLQKEWEDLQGQGKTHHLPRAERREYERKTKLKYNRNKRW